MINSKKIRGNIMLFIAAFIWGTAFVAQRQGVEILDPCTYNGIRSFFGCLALMPVILIMDNNARKKNTYVKDNPKLLAIGGIVCGVILFLASTVQTAALVDADEGKAGFMTALYLIIVPILGMFIGKKIRPIVWLCVVFATLGLYFLCVKEGTRFTFNKSEVLLLLCALVFAFHIMAVDYFSPRLNGVKLSFIQFLVVGLISLVYIVFVGHNQMCISYNICRGIQLRHCIHLADCCSKGHRACGCIYYNEHGVAFCTSCGDCSFGQPA